MELLVSQNLNDKFITEQFCIVIEKGTYSERVASQRLYKNRALAPFILEI